tara:strand:+ start:173 stop:1168 length:996 start_codon:yes stop_codon:yes gene_type:complete
MKEPKFAMIIDVVGDNRKSYYVKNNKAYTLNNDPYEFGISIGNEFYISIWNYPWLYDNGYFLNWVDFGDDLPTLDLDLIFLSIEKQLLNPDFTVDKIRKKYPKAKIVGLIKEIWMGPPYDYNHPKHIARIEFLNQCDHIVTNRPELKEFTQIAENVDKPLNFVAIPVNIDYLYDNYYKEKELALWAYIPNPMDRRGTTYDFAQYISEKYKIPVKYKPLINGQRFDYMSQKEFIDNWSSCAFHLNLDPIDYFPGNQCPLVAATGTINIGGVNDYHHLLYPKTATCDWEILENEIVSYINNPESRNAVIENAWDELNKTFSFEAVKKQIENII